MSFGGRKRLGASRPYRYEGGPQHSARAFHGSGRTRGRSVGGDLSAGAAVAADELDVLGNRQFLTPAIVCTSITAESWRVSRFSALSNMTCSGDIVSGRITGDRDCELDAIVIQDAVLATFDALVVVVQPRAGRDQGIGRRGVNPIRNDARMPLMHWTPRLCDSPGRPGE